ncbi:MAG: hypothetical protein Q8936_10450 [Bacillota bacterium]|nr:hypothetical protein [Bacillota bacterium]
MWFDEIMDDCKNAMRISANNKGIFIPIFVNLGFSIILILCAFVSFLRELIEIFSNDMSDASKTTFFMQHLPRIIITLVLLSILFMIKNAIIEVGTLNLIKVASNGGRITINDFMNGISKYFFKVLGGTVFLALITIVLSPIIIVLFILYAALVGTLTAGWGLIFLSAVILLLFKPWTTIVVVDDISPIKAIGISLKLGKRYFKGLFVIMLSFLLLSSYAAAAFGPLAAVLAGWFLSGIVLIYFKVIILMIYTNNLSRS